MSRSSITWVAMILATLALVDHASAQVRYRRPYSGSYRLGYGYDNDSGGGGCQDYACGGACYNGHRGSDFATPLGTDVVAGAAGRVVSRHDGCATTGFLGSTCGGGCGNHVLLEHSNGSRTIYCHMQNGTVRVSAGATVTCGQVLGRSGSSGNSTGPHLHFGYRASASAAYDDPFSGSCGGPVSLWVGQAGYREAPSTTCQSTCTPSAETCNNRDDDCDGRVDDGVTRSCSSACGSGTQACSAGAWGSCSAPAPRTETCNGADDDCDGSTDEGDLCEVALLNEQPAAYAPPRSTDVNADGTADLCARGVSGVRCWTASTSGWSAPWAPIPWSDASGWDDVTNYATLRMGDLNADGRADVCARANAGVYCALSNGTGFDAASVWRDGLSDANGWNHPKLYTTLRLADVNGDGMDDLCARDTEGFGCWLSNGTAFDRRIEGPRWSDASGWGVAKHYGTIRMGDLDGDRRADVCARSASVVDCWLSNGDGFPTRIEGPRWSGGGWGSMSLWSTIRLVDYDGDGLSDLCARDTEALKCARGTGSGFEAEVVVAALSDASGWADRSNYATLRTGDIDGDGRGDLCLRANAEVYCWSWDGSAWTRRTGPTWSDDSSWNAPRYYQTIRLADFDGDGLDDACARAGAGWRCHPSTVPSQSSSAALQLSSVACSSTSPSQSSSAPLQLSATACSSIMPSQSSSRPLHDSISARHAWPADMIVDQ